MDGRKFERGCLRGRASLHDRGGRCSRLVWASRLALIHWLDRLGVGSRLVRLDRRDPGGAETRAVSADGLPRTRRGLMPSTRPCGAGARPRPSGTAGPGRAWRRRRRPRPRPLPAWSWPCRRRWSRSLRWAPRPWRGRSSETREPARDRPRLRPRCRPRRRVAARRPRSHVSRARAIAGTRAAPSRMMASTCSVGVVRSSGSSTTQELVPSTVPPR